VVNFPERAPARGGSGLRTHDREEGGRAAEAGLAGADIGEQYHQVLDAVTARGELVRLDREHWTTRRHRELEQSVLDAVRARATPAATTGRAT
jgi:hypothetical protein